MSSSLLHADIFFFVTTVITIVVGIFLTAVIISILSILRTVKRISRQAEKGVDAIAESLEETKDSIRDDGLAATAARAFFSALHKRSKKKKADK